MKTILAAAAILAAPGALAQTMSTATPTPSPSSTASATAMAGTISPQLYVDRAGASDLFEQQSAQIVLETTANPKIREFATMMTTDHSKSTADVKAAAAQAKVTPAAPALTPNQRQLITELRAATGTARDRVYLKQQKRAHAAALSLHQSYASTGRSAPLKAAAAAIAPVVQRHIASLNAIAP